MGTAMGVGTGKATAAGDTLGSVAEAKTPRGGSRNPRRDEFLAPRVGASPAARAFRHGTRQRPRREEFPPPQNGVSPAKADTGAPAAAGTGAIQLGLADAEQVDHEDQGAAGELVP